MFENLLELAILSNKLLELCIVSMDILIVIVPGILLKHFSNPNIPGDLTKFKKDFKEDINKIEEYNISKISKKFDKALKFKKIVNNGNNEEEKERDENYIKQLIIHEEFFMELKSHNIKSYEYNKISKSYDLIKRYKNNFNKFYYMAIFFALVSIIFLVLNFDVIILIFLFIIIFFLIIESLRNLYYLDDVQKNIKGIIESIEEEIEHIPHWSDI